MREITEKQQEVLGYIVRFRDTHGYSPTLKEIGARFLIAPRTAKEYIDVLIAKGALRRIDNLPRTLVPLRDIPAA